MKGDVMESIANSIAGNNFARIIAAVGAKPTGPDRLMGHCPAHGSRVRRDLSIALRGDRILIHCFAGCPVEEVMAALGLSMRNLFVNECIPRGARLAATPKPLRLDFRQLAFQFEMAAFDRRARAARVLEAAGKLNIDGLTDQELDRAVNAVATAYEDLSRATLFESMADDLRVRDFDEGSPRHVAA
jgi:hypothetical protein